MADQMVNEFPDGPACNLSLEMMILPAHPLSALKLRNAELDPGALLRFLIDHCHSLKTIKTREGIPVDGRSSQRCIMGPRISLDEHNRLHLHQIKSRRDQSISARLARSKHRVQNRNISQDTKYWTEMS